MVKINYFGEILLLESILFYRGEDCGLLINFGRCEIGNLLRGCWIIYRISR